MRDLVLVVFATLAIACPALAQSSRPSTRNDATHSRTATRSETRSPPDDEGGRGIVWLEAGLGYSYVDIAQLDYDQLLPDEVRLSGSGYTTGVAAGVRLLFFTAGLRGNFSSYPGFDLGSVLVDLALRLPTPVVEPYVRMGFGYGWLGDANYEHPRRSETDVSGGTVEGGLGVDFYLSSILALGVGFDFAVFFMTREGIDANCSGSCDPTSATIEEDGDSVGGQARLHAHASLHF